MPCTARSSNETLSMMPSALSTGRSGVSSEVTVIWLVVSVPCDAIQGDQAIRQSSNGDRHLVGRERALPRDSRRSSNQATRVIKQSEI
eukprot:5258583-Prymnesium_polylepis.2